MRGDGGHLIGLNSKQYAVPVLLFFIFLRSGISAGCGGLTDGLNADILDYHQWKTGERADNMIGIFNWFTTPIATMLGLVAPALLKTVGFTSDWDVLFDHQVFMNAMHIYVYLGVVGLILATVPFIFYDLTRETHDKCVIEIAEREAAAAASAGEATESEATAQ